MNITSINNNRQVSFKGGFRITVPKSVFQGHSDVQAGEFLLKSLNEVCATSSTKWYKKLISKVLHKPEAIGIFQYPSYHINQEDIARYGQSWFEQNLSLRFGRPMKLPKIDGDHYTFCVLTKAEKDKYLQANRFQGKAPEYETVKKAIRKSKPNLDENELDIQTKILLSHLELSAFSAAMNGQDLVHLPAENLNYLKVFLEDIVNFSI